MQAITFSGKAEAGKDASALLVKEKLEKNGKRCIIVHYADYLKFICKQYYGWDGTKSEKGREILQKVGTDLVRKRNPDFWVDTVVNFLNILKPDYDYALIPDTRFPNEILKLKENFTCICTQVTRVGYVNSLTPEQRLHPSETALDGYHHLFDYNIVSKSGLDNLSIEIDNFINYFKL